MEPQVPPGALLLPFAQVAQSLGLVESTYDQASHVSKRVVSKTTGKSKASNTTGSSSASNAPADGSNGTEFNWTQPAEAVFISVCKKKQTHIRSGKLTKKEKFAVVLNELKSKHEDFVDIQCKADNLEKKARSNAQGYLCEI